MILNSECQKEKKKHAFINIHQVFPGILYKFCVGFVVQMDLPDPDTQIHLYLTTWQCMVIYLLINNRSYS